MFAKKIITSRFTIPSVKAQQFQKFSTTVRNSNSRLCPTNRIELLSNQSKYFVTSVGNSLRTFTTTSRVCNNAPQESTESLTVDYDDILKAQKDDKVLIIDVREDSEIQETGKLPGSIHIPMGEVVNSLVNFTSDEFERRYNKKLPDPDTKIILSCRLGKRSGMVQADLQKLGFTNTHNYLGGWLDWESRQKK